MQVSGKLEIFKNRNGYYTAVIKAWGDHKELQGKALMDVALPEDVKVEDGKTLTLDVKEGYLNAVYVKAEKAENSFTKFKLNIVKCDVVDVFPKPEKAKKAKKGSK